MSSLIQRLTKLLVAMWRHPSDKILPARLYMFIVGLYVTAGLACTALFGMWSFEWKVELWLTIMLGVVLPFVGMYISYQSDDWRISTLGYFLVFSSLGLILGPTVARFDSYAIVHSMIIMLIAAAISWIVGVLVPPIGKDFHWPIIAILCTFFLFDAARIAAPTYGNRPNLVTLISWIGSLIFSLLIAYDINKAMQLPRTLDNAVDSAMAIYLDVVNLVLRFLRKPGKRRKAKKINVKSQVAQKQIPVQDPFA